MHGSRGIEAPRGASAPLVGPSYDAVVVANRLREALIAFADAKVEFVVCGGVACILQGVARATHDLDLRLAMDSANVDRFLRAAQGMGLRPRIPEPLAAFADPERRRAWVEEKHAVVYTLNSASGALTVDVFLQYPLEFAELADAADRFEVEGRPIRVSSKRHLIHAKELVRPPRKQDLRDIEDLRELLDE